MGLDPIANLAREAMERRVQAEEDRAFRVFYTRVGRALAMHHSTTGVRITSSTWKIVVSRELETALRIYSRRLKHQSTALEINVGGMRIAGIEVVGDDKLEGDDIRIRAEVKA